MWLRNHKETYRVNEGIQITRRLAEVQVVESSGSLIHTLVHNIYCSIGEASAKKGGQRLVTTSQFMFSFLLKFLLGDLA